jgi:glycosyltransferase involved in cell wall biosynthesis
MQPVALNSIGRVLRGLAGRYLLGEHWSPQLSKRQSNRNCQNMLEDPKISVCMATYNGERFIYAQIASILPQLKGEDELVVVDDCSTDRSVSIIESFQDKRILLLRNPQNCGVLKAFERALRTASGEVIFLADQDDVWRADKVDRFISLFRARPDVSLVQSGIEIIDAAGNISAVPNTKLKRFRPGVIQTLISNSYQGSAMAFHRSILEYSLPFPSDIPMHDMWIGITNHFVGKAAFIEERLLYYRRHGGNVSPSRHAPLLQMIRWRWSLVRNLALVCIRKLRR